jgi:hypothetical protein
MFIPYCPKELGGKIFMQTLPSRYEIIFLELRMFHLGTRRSGTADIIIWDHETKTIVIADWKTNSKNLRRAKPGKKLKGPFNHMLECDLNKYTLQLSDYQNLIEMNTPLKVSERWVIHLSQTPADELDFSALFSDKEFVIDETIPVDYEDDLYRVYKLPDFTDTLKQHYKYYE